jgi:hypothetical protein
MKTIAKLLIALALAAAFAGCAGFVPMPMQDDADAQYQSSSD